MIAQLSMLVVTSVPDTIELLRSRISTPQFMKNLVVNSFSLAGGTIGTLLAGRYGAWAGLVGAMIGSSIFGWASKTVAKKLCKEDSERMQKIVKVAIIELCNDYLIQTEEEFDSCMRKIYFEKAINTDLLRCMQAAGKGEEGENDIVRARIAYTALEYYFYVTIRERKTLQLLGKHHIIDKHIEELVTCLDEAC